MLPDRVSNPGPLTYESGALPIALRGPAHTSWYLKPTDKKLGTVEICIYALLLQICTGLSIKVFVMSIYGLFS